MKHNRNIPEEKRPIAATPTKPILTLGDPAELMKSIIDGGAQVISPRRKPMTFVQEKAIQTESVTLVTVGV